HNTGKVRGLLCWPCNIGLGMFKDNLDLLDKIKIYLTKS
ncbi:MAG: endonuclease domain-containing protein, partial [Pseudomonadota bacterium]